MEFRLLNEKSRLFAGADPYAVSDYVNQHVGSHCIRLPQTGHPAANLSHRSFGSVDLCRISYGGSVQVTSPALETIYHLQILLEGHCLWRGRGEEHYFSPGELLLINPDDPVDLTYSDNCEKFIVKLPAKLIERACSENSWHSPSGGIRFANRHLLQQLDGFVGLLGLVCEEAESEQSLPLVRDHYTRIIASKLLGLLSSNVSRQELPESNPSFERLVQFIDDNLKQDISLEQLAKLAHISPRALYSLFDRHLGTTPKHYIRQRKLEKVHACLSNPATKVRNVTEVALDYGFLHLGRFSESYKSTFGELPSDTLRRREL
ncbi:AraC family transcriptional regulator [Aquipseudomonas alcaligenes]|jgi:AraC-like DNA-binding protein|uniref:AraC family transcriptional regulator BenR n=1 Tax=Aquipseudomonas alcaligenes (strain ATCC 14909 / DSM 50342 / CCUG 1425 / JCM 20561 / NBRC 14159 / NCIMB 9945 / NCTC 10367 / 1577) TaxID=1215092 RepID=U2Z6W6_AQUA1|nr:AraC family transcriptional regulator [Pseudomonas alcaligenes]GAD63486.1 AraC family transcriptional regulator BenR [Pseudomonas alcaligenes NBRC 14159]SUD16878.1 benABC operon transcriptional activator BenR [Pseudomonas alcaligenes]